MWVNVGPSVREILCVTVSEDGVHRNRRLWKMLSSFLAASCSPAMHPLSLYQKKIGVLRTWFREGTRKAGFLLETGVAKLLESSGDVRRDSVKVMGHGRVSYIKANSRTFILLFRRWAGSRCWRFLPTYLTSVANIHVRRHLAGQAVPFGQCPLGLACKRF